MDRARAFGIAILGAGLVFGGGSASALASSTSATLTPAPAVLAPCASTHPDDRSRDGDGEDRVGEGDENGDRGLHLGWERGRGHAQSDAHGRNGKHGRSGAALARHDGRDGENEDRDGSGDDHGQTGDCGGPQTTPPPSGSVGGIPSSTGPVADGYIRYGGTVLDAVTNAPIAGVCVYAGPPTGCPSPGLATDANGQWAFDFPSGPSWAFNFEHLGHLPAQQLTGTTIDVRLAPR